MVGTPRTVVTGAAGFIGHALSAALGASLVRTDAPLCVTDLQPRPERVDEAARDAAATTWVTGDVGDPAVIATLFERPVRRLFHLAAIVSGRAEADFALGKRVNLDASITLLERCRAQAERGGPVARFIYTSSIAVFGAPLPACIDDSTPPVPTLSYGTHKRAIELLIDDYTRRGFIDGRALRLPGVLLRRPLAHGTRAGALSAFNSDVIREPLAGRTFICPVGPDASVWITSLRSAVRNLLALADTDSASLGTQRAVTAPALAIRVRDVVAALGTIDAAAPARVAYRAEPAIEAQFGRWPLDCRFDRAAALDLAVEPSIDALLRHCLEPA